MLRMLGIPPLPRCSSMFLLTILISCSRVYVLYMPFLFIKSRTRVVSSLDCLIRRGQRPSFWWICSFRFCVIILVFGYHINLMVRLGTHCFWSNIVLGGWHSCNVIRLDFRVGLRFTVLQILSRMKIFILAFLDWLNTTIFIFLRL